MPQPGTYVCKLISSDRFAEILRQEWPRGNVISSVGYASNMDIIELISGIRVPVNRDNSELADGDVILAMRMKNRIVDKSKVIAGKGILDAVVADFEFFEIEYKTGDKSSATLKNNEPTYSYLFSRWYDPADESLPREQLIEDKYKLMTGVDIWARHAKSNFWIGMLIGASIVALLNWLI